MKTDFCLGVLTGIGAGVVIGVIGAPRRGDELRRTLADGVHRTAEAAKDQVASVWNSARDAVSDRKEGFRNAVEAGKRAYRETTEPVAGQAGGHA